MECTCSEGETIGRSQTGHDQRVRGQLEIKTVWRRKVLSRNLLSRESKTESRRL